MLCWELPLALETFKSVSPLPDTEGCLFSLLGEHVVIFSLLLMRGSAITACS